MHKQLRNVLCAMFAMCVVACAEQPGFSECRIEGPAHLAPENIRRVHLGMSKDELEHVLGPADYSPTEGQYYFSTGGDCPLADTDRVAPCGVVAEFRDYSGSEAVLTESLQSCWWGAIGE